MTKIVLIPSVALIIAIGLSLSADDARADGWGSYACGPQVTFVHSLNGFCGQTLEACYRFYETTNPNIRSWNVQATVWSDAGWTPQWLRARRLGWDRCSAAVPWSLRIDGSGINYGQTSVQGSTTGTYQNCASVRLYWAEDWGTMKPVPLPEQTNYSAAN